MSENLRNVIYQYQYEICYFHNKQLFAQAEDEKEYYVKLIKERTEALVEYLNQNEAKVQVIKAEQVSERVFTSDELVQYNGLNGNPIYVAVNGVVYDVSKVPVWASGAHFGLNPGRDVTNEFMQCHIGRQDILDKLPKVGVLR